MAFCCQNRLLKQYNEIVFVMLKFSLLVSVYNGAFFLERLFNSLLNQDIPLQDYEIVFVDDFSSDNSVEIIREYQKRFHNIRLFLNEKNKRIATNVNKLVSVACGKYFWLIGQDDYIEENCLGLLWHKLEEEQLDVLLFNYRKVDMHGKNLADFKVFERCNSMSGSSFLSIQFKDRDCCQYVLGYEWRAVYKTDFWKKQEIRCVDGMNYEDTIIMLKAIVYSQSVAAIDDFLYNYRINEKSISYCADFKKRGDLIYEFAFLVGDEVERFYYQLLEINTSLAADLRKHLIKRYNGFQIDLIRTKKEYKKDFYSRVTENFEFVNSKRRWLNLNSKLLLSPLVGFYIACILGWIYRIKKVWG